MSGGGGVLSMAGGWQQRGLTPGRIGAVGLATAFLLAVVLLSGRNYAPQPSDLEVNVDLVGLQAAAGQPAGSSAQPPASYVVFTSSHKTGTVQLLCLSRVIRRVSDVELTTSMGNATTFDVSAALAAADAAPGRPGLMLSVLPLAQECYGQDERRQRFRCPDPSSPCTRTGAPALSLGGPCAMHLPVSDRGAVGLVHFVRNPWDVVVSALWFHLQQPAPEAWIDKEFSTRIDLMVQGGVPPARLREMGLGEEHKSMSYGDVLRSLPEDLAVQLEFWRSAPGLYAMARQFRILRQQPSALQVHYEAAQERFNGTMLQIAQRFWPRDAGAILEAAQECDPTTWSSTQLKGNNHVTAAKHPEGSRERLQGVLAAQPEIRRHLCLLAGAMGYADARCGGDAGEGR